MNDSGVIACPICCSDKCNIQFEKNGYLIYKCQGCSVCFVFPQPPKKEILSIYGADYFRRGNKYQISSTSGAEKSSVLFNEQQKLQKIAEFKTSGNLLDCGCATGEFLYAAKREGFDINGLEVSSTAAEIASRSLEIKIDNCELMDADYSKEFYDVITFWDVVEHLKDPVSVFKKANEILKPDGIIAFSTGDIFSLWARLTGSYWQLLTPPQHLFFFNLKSIETALKLSGFELIEYYYLGKKVKIEFLIFKITETFGNIGILGKLFYGIFGRKKEYITVNLHDIITCVAKKA